jgi:hypothetical protein
MTTTNQVKEVRNPQKSFTLQRMAAFKMRTYLLYWKLSELLHLAMISQPKMPFQDALKQDSHFAFSKIVLFLFYSYMQ